MGGAQTPERGKRGQDQVKAYRPRQQVHAKDHDRVRMGGSTDQGLLLQRVLSAADNRKKEKQDESPGGYCQKAADRRLARAARRMPLRPVQRSFNARDAVVLSDEDKACPSKVNIFVVVAPRLAKWLKPRQAKDNWLRH